MIRIAKARKTTKHLVAGETERRKLVQYTAQELLYGVGRAFETKLPYVLQVDLLQYARILESTILSSFALASIVHPARFPHLHASSFQRGEGNGKVELPTTNLHLPDANSKMFSPFSSCTLVYTYD